MPAIGARTTGGQISSGPIASGANSPAEAGDRPLLLIGEIQEDGQFEVVGQTAGLVVGDAWSDFLPGSKDIIADWTPPISCGNYNTKTEKCSGQNY